MRKATAKDQRRQADADAFGIALKESEGEAIIRMKDLIEVPCTEAKGRGANETAKVTASVKVIELLMDVLTPMPLKNKLEKLRGPALESLRDVVNNGQVAAAGAAAGAFLLRISARAAPGAWPPDITNPSWIERMTKAEKICAT